jgi:hypothetical protein
MNHRRRFEQRPARGAATKPIVLGVLLITAVAAFWLAGRQERPDEANRVSGPGGVSIVRPRDWSIRSINSNGDDHFASIMTLQPQQWIGITPTIVVQTFRSPPTPDQFPGWGQIMFEGQPALSMMYQHPKFRNRVVVMQRGQKWFQVSLTTPDPAADPMDLDLWRFMETFRYDGAAGGSSAATQPALPAFMQPAAQGG